MDRYLCKILMLFCLFFIVACQERQTIVLGLGHIPAQTAQLQVMMGYTRSGAPSQSSVVAEERVTLDFRPYRGKPDLFDLFRIGARPPIGLVGILSVSVAALAEDGRLLGSGDGTIDLPQEGELLLGLDLAASHIAAGVALSGTTTTCERGPLIITDVEQISAPPESATKTQLRLHGFGFHPQATVRLGGLLLDTQWQSFSALDTYVHLPSAPTGVLSTQLAMVQPDGTECQIATKPRTQTFFSALSVAQSNASYLRNFSVAGMPLLPGYDAKETAIGDVDRDGLPDIFLSGSRLQGTGGFLAILRNRGQLLDGNFFDEAEYYEWSGGSGESVVVGDWNKDGMLDAAVTSKTQGKVIVFYQQSAQRGQRFRQITAPGGDRPDFITKGDIDRDGWIDLITGASNDTNGRAVSIVYNLGQTFDMAPPDYLQSVPISLTDLFFTDMNRDGISDFTLLYYRSIPMGSELKTIGAIQSFVEQPDRTLLGTGESLVQGIGGRAAIGDIDGNGAPDIVAAGPYLPQAQAATSAFSVLFNQGNGAYRQPYTAVATISQPYNIVTGDFNLDGKIDVVVASVSAAESGRLAIHLNQGSGVLATQDYPDYLTESAYSTDIEVADFNRDGKLDLVVTTTATPGTKTGSRVQVLLNTTQPSS